MDQLQDIMNKMGVVTQFILDNMNKPVTQLTQAEFNMLYQDYSSAVTQIKKSIPESEIDLPCPVKVPDHIQNDFYDWFQDRLFSFVNSKYGFSSN